MCCNRNVTLFVHFTVYPPCYPAPPAVTEVHALATSCIVTYQRPERDNGAPVTGYILECRTARPDSEWIRVNNTPVTDLQYTINNLTPDTEYEIQVAAMNKTGYKSEFSKEPLKTMKSS